MKYAMVLLIVVVALVAVSLFPVRETETARFAIPAFQNVWQLYSATAARPVDVWGSEPLVSRTEPYYGARDNRRTVQYFERGRMEAESGSSEVSLGLLVKELVSGRIDLGHETSLRQSPPEISIDGSDLNDLVPTYLTLSRIVANGDPSEPQIGSRVDAWVDQSGRVERTTLPTLVRLTEYIEPAGYHLPDVTVELFRRSEFGNGRWSELFGDPISDPFWTYYRRDDELRASLVQLFERRILVYTPGIEPDRRFTVANTGRHYYLWRYGAELTAEQEAPPLEPVSRDISLADGYRAMVYADDVGTPVGIALGPSGHLLVLTQAGEILRAASFDPTGPPGGFYVWAEGIANPTGISTTGAVVRVDTEDGELLFTDSEGYGFEFVPDVLDAAISSNEASSDARLVSDSLGKQYEIVEAPSASIVELDSGDPVLTLDDALVRIDAAVFAADRLYATGIAPDGRPKVVAASSGPGTTDLSGDSVVSFGVGSAIHALESGARTDWPDLDRRGLLIAVESDSRGSLYLLTSSPTTSATELLEFATGFDRPVAMVFGLDGSLFVADSERGQIIRIIYTG